MIAQIGLWSSPADVDSFEEHYQGVHLPLAARVPGVLGIRTARFPVGSPFHRFVELNFESIEAQAAAMASDEWQATKSDAEYMKQNFGVTSTGGVGDVESYPVQPTSGGKRL